MDITYPNHKFEIIKKDKKTRARLTRITTPHGVIETPNFIICGTKASVKACSTRDVKDVGTQIILANTYHMMIQPGADIVEQMGGLHKFMGWDGPMLTDSGGYQIFAMQHGSVSKDTSGEKVAKDKQSLLKITEEGATFRSYKDGAKLFLSPEVAMQVQKKLGADLVVQLDECTANKEGKEYSAKGMEMSMRWGDRSLKEFEKGNDGKQAVYGVIQGAHFEDLRASSVDYINSRPFFGTAIGGSMGKGPQDLDMVTEWCTTRVAEDRPIHLLGYGLVRDIFAAVKLGVDTLDCVHPTRLARHGWAVVKGAPGERINLRNGRFKTDQDPIDASLDCYTSQFSKGYIHHLIKANELLFMQLLTIHNIATMQRLVHEIRECIASDGDLDELEKEWRPEA